MPRSLLEITVELSLAELEPYLKKAAAKISQETEIPGFRKGSAPFDVVKNKVGEMSLYQNGAALAIDDTLAKAAEGKDIAAVGQPEIRVDKLAPGNPFVYTAIWSLLPGIKLANYSKIEVQREPVAVADAQAEKVIDDLREIRASEALTDKAVETSDLVEVDFEVSKDKVVVEGGHGKKYPLVIGKGQMIAGFEEQLLGLKKDQTKEFKLTFPVDYPDKKVAGVNCDFKVKVLAVYKRTLPEVNDEFIKQFGQFKDVAEFKKAVRTNVEADLTRRANQKAELEMLEKIIQNSQFEDIPDVLVNGESRKMIEELKENIQSRGIKFEDYLQQIKKSVDNLILDFAPEALKRVKVALVINKIADQDKVTVSVQDVDKEIKLFAERPGDGGQAKDSRQALDKIGTPAFRRYIENVLINRKVVEQLKAKIIK